MTKITNPETLAQNLKIVYTVMSDPHIHLRREIFQASETGDMERLETALTKWQDPKLVAMRAQDSVEKPNRFHTLLAPDNSNPTFSAAAKGHLAIIRRLNEFDPTLIHAKNIMGCGIIHSVAAADGHALIRPLKDMGLDINARNNRGQTPAHNAAQFGHINTLLEIENNGGNLFFADRDNKTPSDYLWQNGNKKLGVLIATRNQCTAGTVTAAPDCLRA